MFPHLLPLSSHISHISPQYLESIFGLLFQLLQQVTECDTKMQVLHVISCVIERVHIQVSFKNGRNPNGDCHRGGVGPRVPGPQLVYYQHIDLILLNTSAKLNML
jgi:hypothetical protein